MQLLGHRNIKNTLVYTRLITLSFSFSSFMLVFGAIDRSTYQYHVITWNNQRKRQNEAAKRAWNAIGFYGLPS